MQAEDKKVAAQQQEQEHDDVVVTKDKADLLAEQYEDSHHERAGKGAAKAGNEHSVKIHSVRN
jgi:hypothetical protein